jgi:trk system potassium uptake protein TrkH
MNTAIIYRLLGMVLIALSAAFTMCILAGTLNGETLSDISIQAFMVSIVVCMVSAGILLRLGINGSKKLFRREALCVIGLSWILASTVGALPYLLIVEDCTAADALFESTSGLTTTGATAFPNFHEFPKSLLFWRSLSQWFGGMGVVVFFVAILSSLGAGAKILFSNESSGTSSDFDHGRIQSGALYLMLYYLGLSVACLLAYKFGGMTWFQATNHMMTTVSTGGFSTEPMSIEQFQSPLLEWICILFMILGGTTFVFAINLLRMRKNKSKESDEIIYFLAILIVSSLLLTLYLVELHGKLPDHDSFRTAVFQAVSIMTTTGYSSTNFDTWLPAAKIILLILMLIGGCSGSTSGGIKVVRVMIAMRTVFHSVILAFRPNLTKPIRINGRVLSESNIHSVVTFVTLNIIIGVVCMFYVSSIEPSITPMETFSCVQATLFNIGPGFDSFGPTKNFGFLHSLTKVYLSLLMILGRLELYAVLVLFYPKIWKQYS